MRLESGKSSAAQRKKAAELRSPGTVASMARSFWPPGMERRPSRLVSVAPKARRACSEWSRVRMDLGEDGRALCLESCEEDGGLDLRGGDGCVEVDGGERATVNGNGGVALGQLQLRAHRGERFADAFHRADCEGVVANEGEGVRVWGDEAGEHAHGRAGVAAVERGCRLLEGPCGAGDFDVFFMMRDGSAEGGHAGERAVRVCSGGEVGEPGGAFGEAG